MARSVNFASIFLRKRIWKKSFSDPEYPKEIALKTTIQQIVSERGEVIGVDIKYTGGSERRAHAAVAENVQRIDQPDILKCGCYAGEYLNNFPAPLLDAAPIDRTGLARISGHLGPC